eukprot:4326370-Heterocapsa_arctica.AAC.1
MLISVAILAQRQVVHPMNFNNCEYNISDIDSSWFIGAINYLLRTRDFNDCVVICGFGVLPAGLRPSHTAYEINELLSLMRIAW